VYENWDDDQLITHIISEMRLRWHEQRNTVLGELEFIIAELLRPSDIREDTLLLARSGWVRVLPDGTVVNTR
jgi:hypothetical protein